MTTAPTSIFLTAVILCGCAASDESRPLGASAARTANAEPGAVADVRARAVAERVLERLGGRAAWSDTRYVTWNFFGKRRHVWDKWTGDLRLENGERIVLMNVDTGVGRVFDAGVELAAGAQREEALAKAKGMWINDSYWMFMPYKLLDPGVRLAHVGVEELAGDGAASARAADVLEMTFESVGLTPKNRYRVYVAQDSGLVEAWSFYADAADPEPKFTLGWRNWKQFGDIWLCTGHGQGEDWQIAVPRDVPRAVFESPAPIATLGW